jgi:tRNA (cytidine/uridine-2'-O-)-methyltransferase
MKYDPVLHIVLYQPQIHYNAGAVARTCVAIGAKLWLVRPLGFHVDDRHLRRAGLDYWEHLEWEVVDDWAMLCDRLGTDPPWYFSKTASMSYTDVAFRHGDLLVFGAESEGLPRSMLEANPDRAVRVPTRPQVRSLNLSNTVAIVAYEALRQWDETPGGE